MRAGLPKEVISGSALAPVHESPAKFPSLRAQKARMAPGDSAATIICRDAMGGAEGAALCHATNYFPHRRAVCSFPHARQCNVAIVNTPNLG